MRLKDMPVCLSGSAPFCYNAGRLFLCDEVDPELVQRSHVLRGLAAAGTDARLQDSITLDAFNDWRRICSSDDLSTRLVSHESVCNILRVCQHSCCVTVKVESTACKVSRNAFESVPHTFSFGVGAILSDHVPSPAPGCRPRRPSANTAKHELPTVDQQEFRSAESAPHIASCCRKASALTSLHTQIG